MKPEDRIDTDICVCCGRPVAEGRMICYACETGNGRPAPRGAGGIPQDSGKASCPKERIPDAHRN